ncbi:pyruvate dehydrogenase E2 component (dihydrolipoamide acetyltransferase) [Nonomuraea solani]|uniref:Dihydrolipoamide acetyltransferase component of pyruvate dehydrogenase complex n=1 Tax=Nonomuraea solani TaxID=1144553 RepID=A0A1H5UU50_9ACTN|nr:dihydrolipoamide acetyltransferase family protein [Nonomuraea solani]SEF77737.1 pyruvate dehydrogenase E2 component (dihydrolipoamide acetyltransferase) [Nonomuraea solani]
MAGLLRMPEVAANAGEAVLQAWAVPVGAPVKAGDVIATVETDKAVVEVAAETDGVLVRTLVDEGATVAVGTPIAVLGDAGELPGKADALPADQDAPSERPAERIFSSPLARRLAKEAHLGLGDLTGTGPNGRIVRRDVETAIAARSHQKPRSPQELQEPQEQLREPQEVPHSRARRAAAARLTQSKQTAPHFYVRGTAHVGKLLKLRRDLTNSVSINDLVIKAAAQAHVLVPEMNVIWTQEATRTFTTVDLSVAIATPNGLVTPVLKSVEKSSVTTIATTVKDFADRARTGRLRQDELEGGVLTITNLGMHGVEEFAAIINPPQSAILAVGAVRREPVVAKGRVKAAQVMRVTLSVDHRPIDGTVAAAWMRTFLDLLAHPVRILA